MRLMFLDIILNLAALGLVALLLPAEIVAQQITVGPNIQVSLAHKDLPHGEVLIASDPDDSTKLLGCSMMFSRKLGQWTTVVYSSGDGGRTWLASLEVGDPKTITFDPSCAYGPRGTAYAASVTLTPTDSILVYSSEDYGKTWSLASNISKKYPGLDRDFIVIDTTGGERNGEVYIVGLGSLLDFNGVSVYGESLLTSAASGKAFDRPIVMTAGESRGAQTGNAAVLSDGAVTAVTALWSRTPDQDDVLRKRHDPSGSIRMVASNDGGRSFELPVKVSDFYMDYGSPESTSFMPLIAVDPGSSSFKDRLYVIWLDRRLGSNTIFLSYSSDKGVTWSQPRMVSDNHQVSGSELPRDDRNPMLAVSKAGVVGVTWYDRQGNPDNLGWRVRFAASLDGGESFLPSVVVSDKPNEYGKNEEWLLLGSAEMGPELQAHIRLNHFTFSGGDTAGLAADARGVFHPLWIDNRTGIPQVWTTSVKVNGVASPPADIDGLDDVSPYAELELSNLSYDRKSGIVSAVAEIKNLAPRTLIGPVKLKVSLIDSEIGRVVVANADNGLPGPGALWQFSVPGEGLKPGRSSENRRVLFRIENPRSPAEGLNVMEIPDVVRITGKIYGRLTSIR
jgi:hypothetical protein